MPARSLRPFLRLLSTAVLLSAAPALAADPPEPRERYTLGTFLVGRYNPIGFDLQGTLGYRQRIGDSDDLLFKTRFWSLSMMGGWNPANWSARVEAMVEPIAVFQLRAAYDTRGYFGIFGAQLSGSNSRFDITNEALDKSIGSYPAVVHAFTLEPTLQAAIGPVAIRDSFAVEYANWDIPFGHSYVYDPGADLIRPSP